MVRDLEWQNLKISDKKSGKDEYEKFPRMGTDWRLLLLCMSAHQRDSVSCSWVSQGSGWKNDNNVAEVYLSSRPLQCSFAEQKNEVDKVAGLYPEPN